MTYDTLTYAGTEKSFADWGLSLNSIRGTKRAGGQDNLAATLVNSTITAEADTPTFAFESQVIIRVNRTLAAGVFSGGTTKFVGKRIGQPAKASASGHGVSYTFQNAWYDLMNCDYQQLFKGNVSTYLLPEIVLNTSTAVSSGQIMISVGDQIQAILQWLLDQYAAQSMTAPFQYKGRALNSGAIDLNVGATTGTPGGDYSFTGRLYTYHLQSGMSIDTSLFSLFLPTFIEKPMKCGQALQKCVDLSPRVNIWFDYTTTDGSGNPLPTIHFSLVDNMAAVSLPLFTGPKYDGTVTHKDIQINPHPELKARAVIVKYRITSDVSGTKVVDYAVDKWSPSGSNVNLSGSGDNVTDPNCGLRVINELVDLQGSSTSVLKGHLDLELLKCIGGTQATKRTWWALKRGGEFSKIEDSRARFQDKTGAQTTIPDAKFYYASDGFDSVGVAVSANQEFTAADYSFYTYRVVRGSYQTWMKQGFTPILTVKCKAVAQMTFAEYDATSTAGTPDTDTSGNCTKQAFKSDHHVNLELTNAVPDSGTSGYASFVVLATSTPGEAYIIGAGGIAQYLYNHLNVLQFDGDYVMVGANFVDSSSSQYVTLGNRLNLTGGATLWTTMNAQIQEISEDYGKHETSVQIGVSKHLQSGQLSALFNMWRFRRTWYNPNIRSDNTILSGGGEVDMAKSNGGANTTEGLETMTLFQLVDYSTPPSGSSPGVISGAILHDAKAVTDILAATTPTPITGVSSDEIKVMKPREVKMCDEEGSEFYAIVLMGGGYTKP